MPSLAHPDAIFLGMDVHKDSISVGSLATRVMRPPMSRRSSMTRSRYGG